jgi:Tripartite tricarboxylate transporter TctB family
MSVSRAIKSTQDFWTGFAFLAFGGLTAIGSLSYPLGTTARMGPGYFPMMLGILLAAIGAIILFRSFRSEAGGQVARINLLLVFRLLLAVAAFGFLLNSLGMILTAFIVIFLAAWAGPEFELGEALVLAAVLSMAAWLIFVYALKQTMPVWPAPLAAYLGM